MAQQHPAQVIQVDNTHLEVMLHDEAPPLPQTVEVQQETFTTDPVEVAKELTTYWDNFWLRDSQEEQSDLAQWTDFTRLLESVPALPPIEVDRDSLDLWQQAVNTTKSQSSRGMCGFAPDELKVLPAASLQELALVMKQGPQAIPAWLMWARTVPLAKLPGADHPSQSRPITVFSLIYRLWSRVIVKQVLQAWSHRLTSSISGFLPGRCPFRLNYKLQLLLEAHHLRRSIER